MSSAFIENVEIYGDKESSSWIPFVWLAST